MVQEMDRVTLAAGEEIVHAKNVTPFVQKSFAEKRPQES
jgi:hypothetical protein